MTNVAVDFWSDGGPQVHYAFRDANGKYSRSWTAQGRPHNVSVVSLSTVDCTTPVFSLRDVYSGDEGGKLNYALVQAFVVS